MIFMDKKKIIENDPITKQIFVFRCIFPPVYLVPVLDNQSVKTNCELCCLVNRSHYTQSILWKPWAIREMPRWYIIQLNNKSTKTTIKPFQRYEKLISVMDIQMLEVCIEQRNKCKCKQDTFCSSNWQVLFLMTTYSADWGCVDGKVNGQTHSEKDLLEKES